jgi:hypothetical protein
MVTFIFFYEPLLGCRREEHPEENDEENDDAVAVHFIEKVMMSLDDIWRFQYKISQA